MKRKILAWILVFCLSISIIPESIWVLAADLGIVNYESMGMQELLDRDESLTWVFAGDSITHNGSWSQGMNGYAEWFEQYLYELNRGSDVVVNTAWGNADVYDFLYYNDTPNGQGAKANAGMGLENMITSYNPDVVFIKLGMNNRGMSESTFTQYYNLMLKEKYGKV